MDAHGQAQLVLQGCSWIGRWGLRRGRGSTGWVAEEVKMCICSETGAGHVSSKGLELRFYPKAT